MTPEHQMRTEGNKLLHETLKQLVTVSSGSILVLFALMEKVFTAPRWKALAVIAFVGFLICISASVVMMRAISLNVGAAYTINTQPTERPANTIATWSFLLAIVALIAFVMRNLLWR